MAYKMVFSDMDGTLLHKGIRLSVENKEAIRRTVDKGVDFVICTGRAVFGVERFLEELGLIGKKGLNILALIVNCIKSNNGFNLEVNIIDILWYVYVN